MSYFSPVIKGVPSSSVAHVFLIKSEDGSAITCFLIRISLSIFIPNKGDLLENVFIETGSVQLKAPPKALESTDLSFTGSRSVFEPSRLGPANLINIPPFLIQVFNLLLISSPSVPTPGNIITESSLFIRSSI